MVVVSKRSNLDGDVQVALAAIAAEFHVELDVLPGPVRDRVVATLRALSAAHYNAGVRDTMVRLGNTATTFRNERIASPTDVTPVVGPYGRRLRASKMPTPMKPPPRNRGQNDDEDGES